jgi:predicted esterase
MNSPVELGFEHRFIPSSAVRPDLAPTLLLLHGTGGDGDSLLQLGHTLYPRAALLSPTGKVREGQARRFFRRLSEGVFDHEDLVTRTHELATFVRAAVAAYRLDPRRVIAVGYSNGANIAASLLLGGEDVLTGAVLFRPVAPYSPEKSPDLRDVAVLICAGVQDRLAPPAGAELLTGLLTAAGARVEVHQEPTGHELTMGDIHYAAAWLEREFPVGALA